MSEQLDPHLLSLMSEDERAALQELQDDDEAMEAIANADSMSEDELKAALAGKDDDKPEAEEKESKAEEPAIQAAPEATEPEETFRPVLRADLPANATQIREQLQAQQDENERKFREGDIDFDAYKSFDRNASAQIKEIEARELQARIYQDSEQQTATQEWHFTVKQFMKSAKASDGIDYAADQTLNSELDMFTKALASDPKNADRDGDWFLNEAHKRVLTLRGITPKAKQSDIKAEVNASRKPPVASIPKSIGDLPGGEQDIGQGEFAAVDKLSGDAYERALAKMSPDQRNRYLAAS